MSSEYPILDDKPINKWKVAELRDELKKRSLPTKGLKDELVKRLDEAIRNEKEASIESEEEEKNSEGENEPEQDTKVETSGVKIGDESVEHVENEALTMVNNGDDLTKEIEETTVTVTETITIVKEMSVVESPTPLSTVQDNVEGEVLMGESGNIEAIGSQVSEGMTDLPLEKAVESVEEESYSSTQVFEVSHNLGLQESFTNDNDSLTVNEKDKLKDNLTADNVQLEPETVREEMVQPSNHLPDAETNNLQFTPKNDNLDKVEYVNELIDKSPEKIDLPASVEEKTHQDDNDFNKTNDGTDLEKVNFDQSSADDSMEEDISEAKQVDSEHNSSKVSEKTESIKEDVMQEDITPSANRKDSVTVLSEKRKFQDGTESEKKELPKKQRRWNSESQEVSGTTTLFTASTKPNFSRSNSLLIDETPKERVVPPSQKTPTTSLRIDHFLRPFTLKAVQELLGKTGKVTSFWMDHIKTHCYVMYSCVEEATETRNAIYNLQWPVNGGRNLIADYVEPEEVILRLETAPSSLTATPPTPLTAVKAQAQAQAQAQAPPPPLPSPPTPAAITRDPPIMVQQAQSPVVEKMEAEPPIVTLDDLFRKTRTTPRIYYLPLTDEQVAVKVAKQKRDGR